MKQLKKSKNKKIAGVCQGLADWSGIDVVYIRAAWVLVVLLPFVGLFATIGVYAILAYILPQDDDYIDI